MKTITVRIDDDMLLKLRDKVKVEKHKSISKAIVMLLELYLQDEVQFRLVEKAELVTRRLNKD